MTSPVEVTVTAPGFWASRPEQPAQLLTSAAGAGPSVISDSSGRPVDPRVLTVIVSPVLWAADPRALGEALTVAAGGMEGPSAAVGPSRTASGAVAPVEERLVYTVEEAAILLGISRSFAYEAVQRGKIPAMRIGRRILVPKAAFERLLRGDQSTSGTA